MNEDFDKKSMRGFSEPVTQVQGGGRQEEEEGGGDAEGWRVVVTEKVRV